MTSLGQRIKLIRLSLGENTREFGKRFGASDSNVIRWENNTNKPNPERLKAIAELSNQSVGELLNTTDYQKLYEQQKQRADELEKRWSELRDFLNESAMLADEKFQKVNNAALLSEAITCERIVEKMHDLEEDDNA